MLFYPRSGPALDFDLDFHEDGLLPRRRLPVRFIDLGGDLMTSGDREQLAWQLRATLFDALGRTKGLPS